MNVRPTIYLISSPTGISVQDSVWSMGLLFLYPIRFGAILFYMILMYYLFNTNLVLYDYCLYFILFICEYVLNSSIQLKSLYTVFHIIKISIILEENKAKRLLRCRSDFGLSANIYLSTHWSASFWINSSVKWVVAGLKCKIELAYRRTMQKKIHLCRSVALKFYYAV